ncbi:MAG: anti-anti-sigma factor [Cellvibrionaceae bacterium]|jgi:anti-anti-sigma factor
MNNMQINEQTKRVTILTMVDRLDAFNSSSTRAEIDGLIKNGATNFVIDLIDLAFMDSAGIAVLINLFKRVRPLIGGG